MHSLITIKKELGKSEALLKVGKIVLLGFGSWCCELGTKI